MEIIKTILFPIHSLKYQIIDAKINPNTQQYFNEWMSWNGENPINYVTENPPTEVEVSDEHQNWINEKNNDSIPNHII